MGATKWKPHSVLGFQCDISVKQVLSLPAASNCRVWILNDMYQQVQQNGSHILFLGFQCDLVLLQELEVSSLCVSASVVLRNLELLYIAVFLHKTS